MNWTLPTPLLLVTGAVALVPSDAANSRFHSWSVWSWTSHCRLGDDGSRLHGLGVQRLDLLEHAVSCRGAEGRDEVEVAHEALIRHWPRLRAWLDQDPAALLRRETIREAAQEWALHDRDESYLAH